MPVVPGDHPKPPKKRRHPGGNPPGPGGGGGGIPGGPPPPPGPPGGPPPSSPPPSGGGSSGGGTTQPKKPDVANYLLILQNMGIPLGDMARQFAAHARDKRWSSSVFLYWLRQTDFYHAHFPGIRPGMSEARYNSIVESMKTVYAQYVGKRLTREEAAFAIRQQITPQLFAERAKAIAMVDNNRATFNAFEHELRFAGVLGKNEKLKDEDLYKFVMKESPSTWADVWNRAALEASAARAGLHLGAAFSHKYLMQLANQVQAGVRDQAQTAQAFQKVVSDIKTLIPQERMVQLGLTPRDLVRLELTQNAGERARLMGKAQKVLEAFKLAESPGITSQLVQTQQGATVLGAAQVQQETL